MTMIHIKNIEQKAQQSNMVELKSSNAAVRLQEHIDQVSSIKTMMASDEVLESIEAMPYYQTFMH